MRRAGFTVLELIVVIGVITVILAIGMPHLKGMQDANRIVQAKGDLLALQEALESYYASAIPRAYPEETTTLGTDLAAVTPQIAPATPAYDPFGATATSQYGYLLNGKYYVVFSSGPDRVVSTTAISASGVVTTGGDDICLTNGTGCGS